MTKVNLETTRIAKEELLKRDRLNSRSLPPSFADIYSVDVGDRIFFIKKARHHSYGSISSFRDEEEVMKKFFLPYITPSSIFFDIGAAFGGYSLRALLLGAEVIAVEPDPRLIEALMTNVSINPGFGERFYVFEGALGPQIGIVDIDELEDIKMETLDDIVDKCLHPPTFIKIDTEGFESSIIDGGLKAIEKYKPKILIENHMAVNHFLSGEEYTIYDDPYMTAMELSITRTKRMIKNLKSLGYDMKIGPVAGSTYWLFFQ